MRLGSVGVVACAILLPFGPAAAQQAGKVSRLGYLQTAPGDAQLHLIEPFERALSEHGYAIGRDVVIEYRFANGRIERLPELAAELARST